VYIPWYRPTVRRSMIAIVPIAILLTWSAPDLSRRWRACQLVAERHERSASFHLATASQFESRASQLQAWIDGQTSDPGGQALELPPEIDPGNPDWSPAFIPVWLKSLSRHAASEREKASLDLAAGRRCRLAFFLPWEGCILDHDLY
jgi:hypothetical protein